MTVLATADATTVARPAAARAVSPVRTRGTRLRAVPPAPGSPAPPAVEAEPHFAEAEAVAAPVTLTIRIEGGGGPGRDRLLTALRDLVTAAGPGAAVLVASDSRPELQLRNVRTDRDGEIRLDPRPRTVFLDGLPLHLSRLEYDLLLFLARHPKQVFSRSQLLAQVWGHTHTTNRTVDVHVSRLRNKLGDQDLVTTVYGLGYRLADDAQISVAEVADAGVAR
jgi:DNA-binding winged helix-turn-helix (wHTH) protein